MTDPVTTTAEPTDAPALAGAINPVGITTSMAQPTNAPPSPGTKTDSAARGPGAGLSRLQTWVLCRVLAHEDEGGDTAWGMPWRAQSPTPAESAATSRAITRLERRGLIERRNQRTGKRQATHLRLTDQGRAIARRF